jgi:hypothetical protein
VLVSCARSLRRAADAGNEQRVRPATGHPAPAPGQPSHLELSLPDADGEPHGTVASSSARHGWLRRNAVSPVGVRLGGAPGAPLLMDVRRQTGCLPADSDGTVLLPYPGSLPRVGCSPLRRGVRSACREGAIRACGRAMPPPGPSQTHLPSLRTHGNARRNVRALRQSWIYGGYQKYRRLALAHGTGVTGRRA